VSEAGVTAIRSPVCEVASSENVHARRGRSVTVVKNVPSGPTVASALDHAPSLRTSLTFAGGLSPTNLPTTCGVRSLDTAGYWSQTWRPVGGAVGAARPSRLAVAAYSAAPCATSVIGS